MKILIVAIFVGTLINSADVMKRNLKQYFEIQTQIKTQTIEINSNN